MTSLLRCPYCHAAVSGRSAARCRRCDAPHHTACGLELGRCAACGAGEFALGQDERGGWERVDAGRLAAFVRREPRQLPPPGQVPGLLELRLDLVRRELSEGDLLAGGAVLTVREPTQLGVLTLNVDVEETRAGLVRPRRTLRRALALPLLGPPADGARPLAARLLGLPPRGLVAPGTTRVGFRAPLPCGATADVAGATVHRRVVASLLLDRAGAPVRVAVELRVSPDQRPRRADRAIARTSRSSAAGA